MTLVVVAKFDSSRLNIDKVQKDIQKWVSFFIVG